MSGISFYHLIFPFGMPAFIFARGVVASLVLATWLGVGFYWLLAACVFKIWPAPYLFSGVLRWREFFARFGPQRSFTCIASLSVRIIVAILVF